METTNYLEQARSFLTQNATKLALKAVPLALVAVAVAHANPSFNAPNNNTITTNGCSGGSTSGTLTGSPTNGGLGLTLSGNAILTRTGSSGTCIYTLAWKGTGSGAFGGANATVGSNFTLTPQSNVTVSGYTLTVLINGTQASQVACTTDIQVQSNRLANAHVTATSCSGSLVIPATTFSVAGTLNTYEVDLVVNASWNSNTLGTVTVNVPAGSSIDLLTLGAAVSAPALSPFGLLITAILLAVGVYFMAGRKPLPGPEA